VQTTPAPAYATSAFATSAFGDETESSLFATNHHVRPIECLVSHARSFW
jgi:hypothetical protein